MDSNHRSPRRTAGLQPARINHSRNHPYFVGQWWDSNPRKFLMDGAMVPISEVHGAHRALNHSATLTMEVILCHFRFGFKRIIHGFRL